MPAITAQPSSKTNQNNQGENQSVFLPDLNMVKNYPKTMSNDEISFDTHVNVRGNTPEDYYVNAQPQQELTKAFKAAETYMLYGQQAMKLLAVRPDVALGISKDILPDQLAETYKPWSEIWRDTAKKTSEGVEDFARKHPVAGFVPWFLTQQLPADLLEFGTKPSGWIGAYGLEKFGPVVINKIIQKLPPNVRSVMLKEIFKSESKLSSSFETLGLQPNAKTTDVIKAWRNQALNLHPDRGGNADSFIAARQAFDSIMEARKGVINKFFDYFRKDQQQAQKVSGQLPDLSLSSQSGSALLPFNEGDLVKIGSDVGKLMKLSGNIATVNVAGKNIDMALDKIKPYQQGGQEAGGVGAQVEGTGQQVQEGEINPPSEPPMSLGQINPDEPPSESAVNLERLAVTEDAKKNLQQGTEAIADEIQNQTGKTLTHDEVIEKSKEAEILTKGVSREATLNFEAALLKTREHLAALAEQKEITPEFLDTLRVVANTGTDIARQLESFKIDAMPEYATVKTKIIKELQKLGKTNEEIIAASKGVDFSNHNQVADFYRNLVKPKISEVLDEFAYINILSSPKTHIVNAFSNLIQMAGLNPLTRLSTGMVDLVASNLTGKPRERYISEIPKFYKGAINAVPEAFQNASDALQGKTFQERPDVKHIPTKSKFIDYATLGVGKYVPRALEASDIFFRTLIEQGEKEALAERFGGNPNTKQLAQIEKEAKKRAEYYIFRQPIDPSNKTGQGDLLSGIDRMTEAVYRFRDVPGARWFVRFVQTPMNILKQGIENSPAGILTLKGAKDKSEQMGKTIVGSMVFAGAYYMAMSGKSTWALPKGEQERKLFYQSGKVPYSVKIGDRWVSYSKLGPLSYALAMASALHYYENEGPNALSDTAMEKGFKALAGVMGFFSDQSYVQSLGDLLKVFRLDPQGAKLLTNVPTQLIPLSSFQRWVNGIIDPLYRKPSSGISVESMTDNLKSSIIGLSQTLPPQTDLFGKPSKKEDALINAFSPVQEKKSDPKMENLLNQQNKVTQMQNKAKRKTEDLTDKMQRK